SSSSHCASEVDEIACTTMVRSTPAAARIGAMSGGRKARTSGCTFGDIHPYSKHRGSQKCWCESTTGEPMTISKVIYDATTQTSICNQRHSLKQGYFCSNRKWCIPQ